MKRQKNKLTPWERYLTEEIGIEFKACLYFYCILFFYSMYKVIGGSWDASIIHMAEMILATYGMGYLQVYGLSNFDEGEQLKVREVLYIILCSGIYTGISILGKWFDRNIVMSLCFFVYMILAYACAFLVYKLKRNIDGKMLNEDLKAFQERGDSDGKCN